ncbi:hypothetical protein M9H77_37244 [Catharanthus roseus]|uniref:Uncharacterized protein n=1 Tax=Catharanthus roseus TaxID=4058 RepID=A0ACB9ZVZ3_CATRO|nr:hypothetical protein M9H77_37244 [Catharanthus roseus]
MAKRICLNSFSKWTDSAMAAHLPTFRPERRPTVEIRWEDLRVEVECHIGQRALPTLPNRAKFTILKDISGIIKPSRMTLLLGPPSSGKTTLLLALAQRLDRSLKVSGNITYNGHKLNEFVTQKTSAYISQNDVHLGEMTVKETLEFSARCQGSRSELLDELAKREENATEEANIIGFVLKILGLDTCQDTIVGDEMRRGISGGQMKRVTTATKVLLMDEISRGLDSSTTYQILKCLQEIVHLTEATVLISLLQPSPESFDLFDDIILLSEGHIVYQGPCQHVLHFFQTCGFNCPDRKGIADFLQEVTSRKDQEQYWADMGKPYEYITVAQFAEKFKSFHVGLRLAEELSIPYDKSSSHKKALALKKYLVPKRIIIITLVASTVFLRTRMHQRNEDDGEQYIGALLFAMTINVFNGFAELAMAVQRLPVFYKHRDLLFHPPWTFTLPNFLLRVPISLFESIVWVVMTYYTIGFAPDASRFFKQFLLIFLIQQMSMGMFKLVAGLCRTMIIANTAGALVVLLLFLLGGFILPRGLIPIWWRWGYWVSPLSYGFNALAVNEMFAPRWMNKLGVAVLNDFDVFPERNWFWIGASALLGFAILFNILFTFSLMYLNCKRMVLPFKPLAISFESINYFVDMPPDKLQLLDDVTGVFRPGVLSALMGVSGAGKTTLMDVLAGRKTGGYIEGDIRISGFPKKQETFARISGYCEQNDIHSPQVTVYESLIFSAFLRLPKELTKEKKMIFVEEVMELVELDDLKNAIVGIPGVSGLSTEQRKRLTIAVELVANPSIIFMDEPTSGLDARAAAIVMRTVRNTVDTGRTVVCTIHQPSIDIFESFDELLLMKTGGRLIYSGPLGPHSHKMIEYFESIPGVPPIQDKHNPATWMLEVSSVSAEARLGIDFAEHYKSTSLYQENKALLEEMRTTPPEEKDLYFPTTYAQNTWGQFKSCLWKQWIAYWRSPEYNLGRFFFSLVTALMVGTIFWKIGSKRDSNEDLLTIIGAMYAAVLFVGINNCSTIQPIVATERTVFYRERAAGMYSAFPYAMAQVIVEIPYVLIQTTYYTLIVYDMMNFERTPTKFLWFYFITFFSFLYFTYFGMMTISITPNHQVAAILAGGFYTLFNLFAGFFIPRPKIPVWWIWSYWICPLAWTVYGLIVSQYGDIEDTIKVPGMFKDPMIKYYIKEHFGYDQSFMVLVAMVLVGFTVFFAFMYSYCIKKLNFQTR